MDRNDLDPLAALQPITRYPALLVGLGGTGEKALRFVRWLAESPNNQDLQCMLADGSLALFGIDTDPASATEGGGVPLSVIPADLRGGDTREDRAILPPLEDYLVIERSAIEEAYEKLRDEVFRSQERGPDDAELSQEHACILDWLPKPKAGEAAMMSVGATTSQGASQWRPLGRIGLFVKAVRISEELRRLYERVRLAAVRMGQKPRVFVLASLAGGTGGGMFWDIAFMMRLIDRYAYIRGYFLLPDVFEGVDRAGRIWPNAYGALKELAVFKNWRQEPNDTFRVSYPLRGADNEYIAYSGSRPAYNSVFLFRAFPPDIACDPRDASLGDDDRQRFASEVIDKTCLEVARNALCHLRVDVQEELGVGHNNESGDDSDTFRDQKEGGFVFCTSAVAELDVKSIDHLVKRFQATALSRLFKGFDTEAPGQIDQRGLLQELFEGWDPDDGRSDISESDAKNIAVSCLLDQGPIALTDWIGMAKQAKEELAAHLIPAGGPAMASLGKLDVATLFEKAIPERVRKGWHDDALDKKRKAEFPKARLAYVDQLYRIDERIDRARDALERAAAEMSDSNWEVLHPSDAARLSAFRKLVAGAEQTAAERPEVTVTAPPEYLLGRIFFGVVVKAERGLQRVRERHGDEGAPEYLQTVIEAFLASLKRLEIDYRPNGAESSGADKDGLHERARQAVLDRLLARSSEILQPVTAIERADNANRERREVYRKKLRGPIGEIGSYAEKTEELAPLVEPLTRKIADLKLRQQGPVHDVIADQLAGVLAADPRVPEFVGDRGASKDDLYKVLHEELAGPLEDMCRDLESSGREPIEIFIDTLLKFPHTLNIKRIGTPIEFEKALKYHRLLSEFFVMYWLDQHEFFLGRLGGEGGARRLLSGLKAEVFRAGPVKNTIRIENLLVMPPRSSPALPPELADRNQRGIVKSLSLLARRELFVTELPRGKSSSNPLIYYEDLFRAPQELSSIRRYFRAYDSEPEDRRIYFHLYPGAAALPELIETVEPPRPIHCGNPGCKRDLRGVARTEILCPKCHEPIQNRCGNAGCAENDLQGRLEEARKKRPAGRDDEIHDCPTCGKPIRTLWWQCSDGEHRDRHISTRSRSCPQCLKDFRDGKRAETKIRRFGPLEKIDCPGCRQIETDPERVERLPIDFKTYFDDGVGRNALIAFQGLLKRHEISAHRCRNGTREHFLFPTCPKTRDGHIHHLTRVEGIFVCEEHPELKFSACWSCAYPIDVSSAAVEQGERLRCERCTRSVTACHFCYPAAPTLVEPRTKEGKSYEACPYCKNPVKPLEPAVDPARLEDRLWHTDTPAFCPNLYGCRAGADPYRAIATYDDVHCRACTEKGAPLLAYDELVEIVDSCPLCLILVGRWHEGAVQYLGKEEAVTHIQGLIDNGFSGLGIDDACALCGTRRGAMYEWMKSSGGPQEAGQGDKGKSDAAVASAGDAKAMISSLAGISFDVFREVAENMKKNQDDRDLYSELRTKRIIDDVDGFFTEETLGKIETIFNHQSACGRSFSRRFRELVKIHNERRGRRRV